jgi:hypothetical protein
LTIDFTCCKEKEKRGQHEAVACMPPAYPQAMHETAPRIAKAQPPLSDEEATSTANACSTPRKNPMRGIV